MILNRPVAEIVGEFNDRYRNLQITIRQFLQANSVDLQRMYADEHTTVPDERLYLCTVASLNKPGKLHCILWDMRDGPDQGRVFDPAEGREGVRYYVSPYTVGDLQPNQERLVSYVLDNAIIHAPWLGIEEGK